MGTGMARTEGEAMTDAAEFWHRTKSGTWKQCPDQNDRCHLKQHELRQPAMTNAAEKKAREIVQGWAFDIAEAHGTILPVNSTKPLIAAIAASLKEVQEAERICPKCGIRIGHECGESNEF